jgi:hypothetical protein
MFRSKKGAAHMTEDITAEDITAILERPTCSVAELGRILAISKNPAYDAVNRGDFPSIRVRKRIRVLTAPLRRTLGMEPAPGTGSR